VEFKAFAKDVVLFCHVTTRVPEDPYQDLLRAIGGKYYPTLVFMDGMGKVVGKVDIFDELTVPKFRAAHEKTKRRLALIGKEEPGDAERIELFLLDGALGMLEFDEAKERAGKLGKLEGDAAKEVAAVVTNLEVADHLDPRPSGLDAVKEVGRAFHEMAKAGRVPTTSRLLGGFWTYMFAWAEAEKDVEAARWIVGEVRKLARTDESAKGYLKRMEERLKALQPK